jgi:hypothetical protein
MKGVVLGIMTAIFVFLLLVVLLQNRVSPPPPLPQQATLAAVSTEATRVAEQATQTAAERTVMATTEAIQTETSQIQTRSAGEADSAPASPTGQEPIPAQERGNPTPSGTPLAGDARVGPPGGR